MICDDRQEIDIRLTRGKQQGQGAHGLSGLGMGVLRAPSLAICRQY
jgi:hypothetical protein